MTQMKTYSILLALFLGLTLTQGATAQDGTDVLTDRANRVANHCIRHIKSIALRSCRYSRHVSARCVNAIEDLLANGHEERAARLAEHCKQRICRKADAAADRIQKICQRCIRFLREHGAHEAADRVAQACQEALAKVRQCKHAAVAAIEGALGGAGGGPGGGGDGGD